MQRFTILLTLAATVFSFTYYNNSNKDLDQCLGKWVARDNVASYYEEWTKVSDELYMASGYTIIKDDTVFREKLRIEMIAGYYVYIASPNGAKPTMFPLKSNDDGKWVFENKEHDFPQRIIYDFSIRNKMYVTVTGPMNGEVKSDEYNFIKVN